MSDPRLLTDRNVWLATVRDNGKPHLVPIWFVWVREKFFICTEGKSVKVKNLRRSPRASVALEDGNKPIIAECTVHFTEQPYPLDVVAEFKQKYQWDILTDASYNVLLEITPEKWLKW